MEGNQSIRQVCLETLTNADYQLTSKSHSTLAQSFTKQTSAELNYKLGIFPATFAEKHERFQSIHLNFINDFVMQNLLEFNNDNCNN